MRNLFIILLLVAYACPMRAQEMSQNSDVNNILTYIRHAMLFNQAAPQEKVYLHFDNTGYFRGETIRFKAYLNRMDNGQKSNISKVLYVELVNPSGDVCERRTLKVVDGEAEGDIRLDSIIGLSGFYEVRAFTRYMTNWGTSAVFSRVFPIFNAPKNDGDYLKPVIDKSGSRNRLPNTRVDENGKMVESTSDLNRSSVKFYPEGGDLVQGLKGRVAFVVTDENGYRRKINGALLDANKTKICDVETDESGRGMFELVANGEKKYLQTKVNGKSHEYELPAAKTDGCTMQLDALDEDVISVIINSSSSVQGRMLGYAVIHNGNIVACDTMTAQAKIEKQFSRYSLPQGVNQLTVFDSNGQIVSERLFFIYPYANESDSIYITTEQKSITPCGTISVNIKSAPNSSISFSAMDAATTVNGSEGNMKTWMLLTSDLGGYIDSPDYYFEADDEEHRRAADLLMMTQGWRRYDWNLMAGLRRLEKSEPVEDGLYLFGKLLSVGKKRSLDNVDLTAYLFNRKGESMSGKTSTDSIGRYSFQLPECYDDWSLQIKSKKDGKAEDYIIAIDRNFSPAMRMLSPYELRTIPVGESNFFKESDKEPEDEEYVSITKKTHVLPTVKIRSRRILGDEHVTWFDEDQAQKTALVYYDCDTYADQIADEGRDIPTFDDWLKSKNSLIDGKSDPLVDDMVYVKPTEGGVLEEGEEEGIVSRVENEMQRDELYNTSGEKPIICYRDGLTYDRRPIVWIVNNMFCTITNFTRTKFNFKRTNNRAGVIERPDFLNEVKSVYFTDNVSVLYHYIESTDIYSLNPVIAFVYTHPLFYFKEKGLRKSHFYGYNKPTKFEMEDYSVLPPTEDFRRTLYWDANVKTDAKGNAKIEFYNNSSAKQIFVSAEGETPEGNYLISE